MKKIIYFIALAFILTSCEGIISVEATVLDSISHKPLSDVTVNNISGGYRIYNDWRNENNLPKGDSISTDSTGNFRLTVMTGRLIWKTPKLYLSFAKKGYTSIKKKKLTAKDTIIYLSPINKRL